MSTVATLLITALFTTIYATPNDFTYDNDQYSCLTGQCSHTCSSLECANKFFICPSSASSCTINCHGSQSCKDTKIYGAAGTVILNCNGTNSCDGIQYICGTPPSLPIYLPYTLSQFNGRVKDCFVNLLSPNTMTLSHISCHGSITNCVIDAYDDNSISNSQFQCDIDTIPNSNGCELNCLEQTSCTNIEFECTTLTHCTCGIGDKLCTNTAVTLSEPSQTTLAPVQTTDIIADMTHTTDQYNCLDLLHTEIMIRSIVQSQLYPNGKVSVWNYALYGQDSSHNTILFRYKYISEEINDRSLSSNTHEIHRSVGFTETEINGNTYDFEWEFNDPAIICWLTDELSAIKIDLYYDNTIPFAFTYLRLSQNIVYNTGHSKSIYTLTAKNNWNLKEENEEGLTYLQEGYLYFDFHYNVTLYNPISESPTGFPTLDPTREPTQIVVIPSQTTKDDGHIDTDSSDHASIVARESVESMESTKVNEREVIETTDTVDVNNMSGNVVKPANHETHIKAILFGIALAAVCSICCIITCCIYQQKRRSKEGMEAAYASAAGNGTSSDDDRIGIITKGNEADVDDTDKDEIGPLHNHERDRMNSGIIDPNDSIDYNNKRQSLSANSVHSQTSLIKKYLKRDAKNIIIAGNFSTINREESLSESGVGYIANTKMIAGNDEDMHGLSDDESESLVARDRDISMDAEYNHVHCPQISIMQDSDLLQGNISPTEEESVSISVTEDVIVPNNDSGGKHMKNMTSSVTVTYDKAPNMNNVFPKHGSSHNKKSSLGFEAGSVLDHYVNQDSTFQNNKRELSLSRLSQSLSIPPIQLTEDITSVKTVKTKTTVQTAAQTMKLFSQKIAKAAVKFGHNPLNPQSNKRGSDDIDREVSVSKSVSESQSNQFATMVIYRNERSSKIPQSQIKTSVTPPPIPSIDAIHSKFMKPISTQTMIVKDIDQNMSDDTSESSSDKTQRDPIDGSEEEDIAERRRHRKNLSSVSDKSHHDRRSMVITDDLSINHLVRSIEEEEMEQNGNGVFGKIILDI